MQSFTTEDLIQYVYNETSIQKTAAIKLALETDWTLREIHEEIVTTHKSLEMKLLSPRKQAVDKILAYAENSVTHLTTQV